MYRAPKGWSWPAPQAAWTPVDPSLWTRAVATAMLLPSGLGPLDAARGDVPLERLDVRGRRYRGCISVSPAPKGLQATQGPQAAGPWKQPPAIAGSLQLPARTRGLFGRAVPLDAGRPNAMHLHLLLRTACLLLAQNKAQLGALLRPGKPNY